MPALLEIVLLSTSKQTMFDKLLDCRTNNKQTSKSTLWSSYVAKEILHDCCWQVHTAHAQSTRMKNLTRCWK